MAVVIEALTAQGLGRGDDGEYYPRTLPGEDIDPSVSEGFRILTPSPDRVKPPCQHYKSCGGCALQHGRESFVATWKRSVVARALAARGLRPEIGDTQTSPQGSRRRAKFAGRRTKSGPLVGFYKRASHDIIDTPGCILMRPSIVAARPALAALTELAATRKTPAAFTVIETLVGVDVLVQSDLPLDGKLRIALADLAQRFDLARLSWGNETIVVREQPFQTFGATRVVPPPGAFLQATPEGEATLVNRVAEIVGEARRIVDLFSGCGTFTLPLAQNAQIHAVEMDRPLIDALLKGWRAAQGLRHVDGEARDLFRRPLTSDELDRFDAIVVDPPRAGAETQTHEIAASKVPVVAMVSCNPVTFARDAAVLCEAGFRLDRVDVVDQFRWSANVELVGGFKRM